MKRSFLNRSLALRMATDVKQIGSAHVGSPLKNPVTLQGAMANIINTSNRTITKTADQCVYNTTTLVSDTQLHISCSANTIYYIDFHIIFDIGNPAATEANSMFFPAGTTWVRGNATLISVVGNVYTWDIPWTITIGSTAGMAGFQFAQIIAFPANLCVKAGSYMTVATRGSTPLDNNAPPTDTTQLDATTSMHGLAPKATAPAASQMNVLGLKYGDTTYHNYTVREILTANRTYYVDTATGNDSNNGLASGAGHAFLTIQHACDIVGGLDINGYNVIISVAAGTYTEWVSLPDVVGYANQNNLKIIGASYGTVTVTTSSANHGTFQAVNISSIWNIQDMTVISNVAYFGSLYTVNATLRFSGLCFGAATFAHIYATRGGVINSSGAYYISGNATYHVAATQQGQVSIAHGCTLLASVTFTNYASSIYASEIMFNVAPVTLGAYTISGGACDVNSDSILIVGGTGYNTSPWTLTPAVTGGGVYINNLIPMQGIAGGSGSVGFFGVAPAARPSAYTQTYSTASKTVPNNTASDPPAGGTGATAGAYDTAAHRDAMITSLTNAIADITALKKVVNSLIDDLQALGILQ